MVPATLLFFPYIQFNVAAGWTPQFEDEGAPCQAAEPFCQPPDPDWQLPDSFASNIAAVPLE